MNVSIGHTPCVQLQAEITFLGVFYEHLLHIVLREIEVK